MDTAYLDDAVADLAANKQSFATAPVREKIAMLGRLRERTGLMARGWVQAATRAKGIAMDSPFAGEEWTSGPYALAAGINALETTLRRIAEGRHVLDGLPVSTRGDGRVVVRVFPADAQDRVFFSGHRADVWMQPGVTEATLGDTVASFYRKRHPEGAVALVLGAGNIASIPPLDALYRMLVHGNVAIVKLNPVNDYLGAFFEEIFAPVGDAGWIRFAYGGPDVGSYLAHHPGVDHVHITGSDASHDALVFGRGEEGAARKADERPLLQKPVSSELGGVTPTIVVPGEWSAADFRHQAEHIATQKLHNASYNCVSCQVLVLPEGWSGADRLLEEIRRVAVSVPQRDLYYPGTVERLEAVARAHPHATAAFEGSQMLIVDPVHPDQHGAHGLAAEVFAPALSVTRLPGRSVPEYLSNAARFADNSIAGNLGVNIIIDPPTARAHAASLERAIADLHYGTIAVNTWTGVGYAMPRVPWGAFPGATPGRVGSGIGVVHNALMLERSERTVIRGPFAPFPRSLRWGESHVEQRPPFFVTNGNAAVIGERLTRQAVSRSWKDMPGILSAAIRG